LEVNTDPAVPTFPGGYHPPVVARVKVPAIFVSSTNVMLFKVRVPAPVPEIEGFELLSITHCSKVFVPVEFIATALVEDPEKVHPSKVIALFPVRATSSSN
jgi:hypothetical protein